jgi:hypothetical protein
MGGNNTERRETVHHQGSQTCAWCGSKGRMLKKKGFALYIWSFSSPMGRGLGRTRPFCSLGCRRSYG